ncbi:MAG: squalene/phytoene synthase family protein [Alphaproteobacteria bacterium]|nr:squalene/phytoene synthase family protein [Alphaproteobacteria bacterium]
MTAAPPLSPCADLVRRGDPDRFLSAMTAPPALRERLFALYAFNLELARIPGVVSEPMLGLMRLQWWRDAVAAAFDTGRAAGHEVAEPLARTIRAADLPRAAFERLLDARAQDVTAEPFADAAALNAYLRDTGGALMALAARALGDGDGPAEDAGFALGAASWLAAAPALAAAGRAPFPADAEPRAAAQTLAREGLAALSRARARRARVPPAARAAYLAGWRAGPTLGACLRADYDPLTGPGEASAFRNRAGLLWAAATGRW